MSDIKRILVVIAQRIKPDFDQYFACACVMGMLDDLERLL